MQLYIFFLSNYPPPPPGVHNMVRTPQLYVAMPLHILSSHQKWFPYAFIQEYDFTIMRRGIAKRCMLSSLPSTSSLHVHSLHLIVHPFHEHWEPTTSSTFASSPLFYPCLVHIAHTNLLTFNPSTSRNSPFSHTLPTITYKLFSTPTLPSQSKLWLPPRIHIIYMLKKWVTIGGDST